MPEKDRAGLCPEKICDCLYFMEMDRYPFEPMPKEPSLLFTFGCSAVRKGNFYGRNLDLGNCKTPEFVIRMSSSGGRFASLGVCADPTVSDRVEEITQDQLYAMPNITNDGINENGVIVSENVTDAYGVDLMTGTAPGRERIHASRVVRYLLDRAESAGHALRLLGEVDIVGGFTGCALHWMIADEKDTFIVEIIDGVLTVSRNQYRVLTNFYLNYGPVQETQTVAGTQFENVPLLNEHAIGVERWCILRDGYESVSSPEDMAGLLASVRSTAMYDKTNEPAWFTECTGGELSIHSEKAAFEEELTRQIDHYHEGNGPAPADSWLTWHTSVYEFDARSLRVYSREDYSKAYQFTLAQ